MQPHMETGYAHLDLSKPIVVADEVVSPKPSLSAPKSSPTKSSSTSTLTSAALPLSASQRFAFVHAIFCTVGFLVFLPAGALVARWARTFTPAWYTAHWIAQFAAGMCGISTNLYCFLIFARSWTCYSHRCCARCGGSQQES